MPPLSGVCAQAMQDSLPGMCLELVEPLDARRELDLVDVDGKGWPPIIRRHNLADPILFANFPAKNCNVWEYKTKNDNIEQQKYNETDSKKERDKSI